MTDSFDPGRDTVPSWPLVPGTMFEAVLRLGGVFTRVARTGEPALLFMLYRRNALLRARGLAKDFTTPPPAGNLVVVGGTVRRDIDGDYVRLRMLSAIQSPRSETSIFDLAFPEWCVDKEVVRRAIRVWESLSPAYRDFVNLVLKDARILRGFLRAPGSVRHHHAYAGGCIEHSVDLAENASDLLQRYRAANRDIAVTATLLHDVGKATEYCRDDDSEYRLSEYGRLVGHKIAGIQLVTIAATSSTLLTSREKMLLLHALCACRAPDYVGLRPPQTPEAVIVHSGIDRLSGDLQRFVESSRATGTSAFGPPGTHRKANVDSGK